MTKKQLKEFNNRMMKVAEDFNVKECDDPFLKQVYTHYVEGRTGKYYFQIDDDVKSIYSIFGRIKGIENKKVNFHCKDIEIIDCSFWRFLSDFTYQSTI